MAHAHACRQGLHDVADDFAQDCAVLWLSGRRHVKTAFQFLLVDYIRIHGSARANRVDNTRLSTDAMLRRCALGITNATQLPAAASSPRSDFMPDETLLQGLSERSRACAILYYRWGMTLLEIGHVFGISEAGVSMLVTEFNKKAKAACT